MDEHFFVYNNQFFLQDVPVIGVQNRSFRYGDGLFETMRMFKGKIINIDFHFQRLYAGMRMLELKIPTYFSVSFFTDTVDKLLSKNSIFENARIRLMVFRGDEGLFEIENNSTNYLLETFPLSGNIELNEKGLILNVFPSVAKSCDKLSSIKSNNYLPSIMAARFAKKNDLSEAIILNAFGRVCEVSMANIFIINGEKIFTPPLSEGCVAGVMRRWMQENFSHPNFTMEEKALSVDEILSADELFLTNSIQPIRWVKQFRNKSYRNEKVKEIFAHVIANIFPQ